MAMTKTLVMALLGWSAIAAADVHANKTAKVSLDIPKTYTMTEQDDLMRGASSDKAVALLFWVIDTNDPDEAIKKLTGELYSAVGSLQWDKPKADKLNGLPVKWIDGTGRSVGNHLDISMVLAGPTADKKNVMVVALVDHAKADAHKAEIAAILKSLKPTK
jgi:hypothetical protein